MLDMVDKSIQNHANDEYLTSRREQLNLLRKHSDKINAFMKSILEEIIRTQKTDLIESCQLHKDNG